MAAGIIVRLLDGRAVFLGDNVLMCKIGVFGLDMIKVIRINPNVEKVDLYKNDVETIKGLFDGDD